MSVLSPLEETVMFNLFVVRYFRETERSMGDIFGFVGCDVEKRSFSDYQKFCENETAMKFMKDLFQETMKVLMKTTTTSILPQSLFESLLKN